MSKYTKEVLQEAISYSLSIAQVIRFLGLKEAGGNYSHIKRRIKFYNIDTSHFLGQRTNSGIRHKGVKKITWQEILIKRETGTRQRSNFLRRALLEFGKEYKCVNCDNKGEWNGKKLVLEHHHKNENWLDDRAENVDFICPNCHSQI